MPSTNETTPGHNLRSDSHDVDQLATHLASTTLHHCALEPSTSFPPNTSLDEQLLILAGVQDYHISGSPNQTFDSTEVARFQDRTFPGQETADQDIRHMMDAHLNHLNDAELAGLMRSSLHIQTPSNNPPHNATSYATQQPVEATNTFTSALPPVPSFPCGTLSELQDYYRAILSTATSPHALAHAPLPADNADLAVLSAFMASEMQNRAARGAVVVFSSFAHPCYPLWSRS
ncbi:hypothetical protein FB567DRAFT_553754 [Paraphoma chrysanthemicola]|uniref:Uncharacterized protein n=1 Tax=Paraphoma chrysanthemicola TaxID=798071 RepID=A0A8K0QXX1_9PLEO|nr:hypothetical protein FB567DRAFT_553754 [Paraphoma chrysanthemicola]